MEILDAVVALLNRAHSTCSSYGADSFLDLAKLAAIIIALLVTTATVERTFSSIKLVKTRLRNRMGENTLEYTMRICIGSPNPLLNETLAEIIDHSKHTKELL